MESVRDIAEAKSEHFKSFQRRLCRWVAGCALLAGGPAALDAQSVNLAWDPSPSTNVAGYNVYYGVASGQYGAPQDAQNATLATVTNLSPGFTYYFAVTAYTSNRVESDPSEELIYTVPDPTLGTNTPALNPLSNLSVNEDAGQQTVALQGIGSGAAGLTGQGLRVTAVSSDPALIPNPAVTYTSPGVTGTLRLTPAANAFGSATITVTVNNFQPSNNLAVRRFTVTVNPVNDPPTLNALSNLSLATDAGPQAVNLSGLGSGAANETQTLTLAAVSSNPAVVPHPVVSYVSGSSTATLFFTPTAGASGSATITVTVNDGQTHSNLFNRSFTVTVGSSFSAGPLIFLEAESGSLAGPMIVATNTGASNGRYVLTQVGEQGTVTFNFGVSQPGDYAVWCRVLSTNNSSDSFYVAVDGGTEYIYRTVTNTYSTQWQWTRVADPTTGIARRFTLGTGAHTLRFRGREAATLLDAFFVTSDFTFIPSPNFSPQRLTLTQVSNPLRGMQLNFPAVAGGRYEVQYSRDLRSWAPFWTSPTAASNQTFSVVDPTQPALGRRFFRTRLLDAAAPSTLPLRLRIDHLPGLGGGAQIGFQPEVGLRYEIQATEDFRTWTTVWISPVAASTQPMLFVDSTPTASGKRFYRARPIEAAAASLTPLRVDIARVTSPIRGTQISFAASSGFRYAVQASEDLRAWTTIWNSVVTMGNRSYHVVDTAQTPSRKRFYRVQITD
jgi:hypothetical protein